MSRIEQKAQELSHSLFAWRKTDRPALMRRRTDAKVLASDAARFDDIKTVLK